MLLEASLDSQAAGQAVVTMLRLQNALGQAPAADHLLLQQTSLSAEQQLIIRSTATGCRSCWPTTAAVQSGNNCIHSKVALLLLCACVPQGFPTIKFFYVSNGKIKSSAYNGGRSAKEIVTFALDKVRRQEQQQMPQQVAR